MGLINWIFERNSKTIAIDLPTPLVHALETITFMQNQHNPSQEVDITRDDIVALALAEYMEKNLWTNAVRGTTLQLPPKPATDIRRRSVN